MDVSRSRRRGDLALRDPHSLWEMAKCWVRLLGQRRGIVGCMPDTVMGRSDGGC